MGVNRGLLALRLAHRLPLMVLFFLGVCRADVPTPAQECRLRNAAICAVNGVPFMVDGPCPAGARTIRPPGKERCDSEAPREAPRGGQERSIEMAAAPALLPTSPPPSTLSTPGSDMAWVGRAERWLLPLLMAVGGLLLGGLCVLAWRWRGKARRAASSGPELGRSLLRFLVAAACAVPLAYQAAAVIFWRVFSSADNHDTALPWLLAAPLAVVVFVLVSLLAFALVSLLLGRLFKGNRHDSPTDRRPGEGGGADGGSGRGEGRGWPCSCWGGT